MERNSVLKSNFHLGTSKSNIKPPTPQKNFFSIFYWCNFIQSESTTQRIILDISKQIVATPQKKAKVYVNVKKMIFTTSGITLSQKNSEKWQATEWAPQAVLSSFERHTKVNYTVEAIRINLILITQPETSACADYVMNIGSEFEIEESSMNSNWILLRSRSFGKGMNPSHWFSLDMDQIVGQTGLFNLGW